MVQNNKEDLGKMYCAEYVLSTKREMFLTDCMQSWVWFQLISSETLPGSLVVFPPLQCLLYLFM